VTNELYYLALLQFREAFNAVTLLVVPLVFVLGFLVHGERHGLVKKLGISGALWICVVAVLWLLPNGGMRDTLPTLTVDGDALSITCPVNTLGPVLAFLILFGVTALVLTRRRHIAWPQGRIRLVLALLLLLGLNFAAVTARIMVARSAAPMPNVVLISIDTLRPDHLGCYGYSRDTSPTIDSLAGEGVRFETVIVPMSHTLPTHVSLLTGLYPLSHGVTMNGMDLGPEISTLTEFFKNNGFVTAAFVGSVVLDGDRGLARGFDVYEEALGQERIAEEVRASAEQWLGRAAEDPFFMFAHFWDPHEPYSPPDSFAQRFEVAPRELGEIYLNAIYDHAHLQSLDPDFDDERLPELVQREIDGYDSEIRYVDLELGKLFDTLKRLGHWDDTLVVLTSDHGEGLGERGWWGHELFYEEHIRAPLIVKLPESRSAPSTVRTPVGTLDIMPTVLDFLGVSPPKKIAGRSLLDFIETEAGAESRTFLLERRDYPWGMRMLHPELWGRGKEYAARTDEWKLTVRLSGEDELYNLKEDPLELQNLVGQENDLAAHLRLVLYDWLEASGRNEPVTDATAQMDEETIEHLKSLGYIQ
jgi:arylsulfatase A-like enzyme